MARLKQYTVKKKCVLCINCDPGEVRILSDSEIQHREHLVEPVNSLSGKPNKKYKKGINKGV